MSASGNAIAACFPKSVLRASFTAKQTVHALKAMAKVGQNKTRIQIPTLISIDFDYKQIEEIKIKVFERKNGEGFALWNRYCLTEESLRHPSFDPPWQEHIGFLPILKQEYRTQNSATSTWLPS